MIKLKNIIKKLINKVSGQFRKRQDNQTINNITNTSNEVLIELPFGEKFKKIWEEYVEFVEATFYSGKDKTTLVGQKNKAIDYIKTESKTEEEAISIVKDFIRIVKRVHEYNQEKLRNL